MRRFAYAHTLMLAAMGAAREATAPVGRTSAGVEAAAPASRPAEAPVGAAPSAAPDAADVGRTSETAAGTNGSYIRANLAERIEMHLNEVPIADALRMLADETRRNIVASRGVTGTVTANLYDVRYEEAIEAILRAGHLAHEQQGDFTYVYTREELDALRRSSRKLVTRVFPLKFLNAQDALALIAPLLSDSAKTASTPVPGGSSTAAGGASSGSSSGSSRQTQATGDGNALSAPDAIIITDDTERIERIAGLLKELDVLPKQVLIEATILRATLTEDNAMGIDFTTLGGVDFVQVSSVSPAAQGVATGNTPTPELDNTTFTIRSALNQAVPGGGLTFGIVKNQVGAFVRALEQVADTSVIANPKVLALNKQRGEVIVGRRDGYFTTTVTETAAIQTVEFLETGTQLIFRPYVMDEFVRMEIHPKDSTGGLTAANLPFEQTTEVTTNVLVRDGHTILIGGLFREVDGANRGQVPGLGSVPIAGALFQNNVDRTVREEVIILMTVRIVKGPPEEREASELADHVERHRIGMRRGMNPLGRERVAQAHYRWALEHLAAGRRTRALWDARLALHNAPRFIPAQELVERLERERMWDEDASVVREHLHRLMAEDENRAPRLFGRPEAGRPGDEGGAGSATPPAGGLDEDESVERSAASRKGL